MLRISIDKPEGVTHADCELVSQQVGTILDVEDVVPGHYTLEVSSPGVERKLFKPKDFERFQGKKAKDHPARAGREARTLGRHARRITPTASICLETEPGKTRSSSRSTRCRRPT